MENTIYAIKCPKTNVVVYVGKSKKLKARIAQHLGNNSKLTERKLTIWIKALKEEGLIPVFEVIEILEGDNWGEREIFWINHFRSKSKLFNQTLGGAGCLGRKMNHSEKTKIKISISKSGAFKKGKDVVLEKFNGTVLTFKSLTEASKITGISIKAISNNLKNYSKSTLIGIWKYKTH